MSKDHHVWLQLCLRAQFLAQRYLWGVEEAYGRWPKEESKSKGARRSPSDGFPRAMRPAWRWALEYAASERESTSRKYHNNVTPENYAILFPFACVYGALRSSFIPIEPLLCKHGGWRRGVPFSKFAYRDTPQAVAFERAGFDLKRMPFVYDEILKELRDEYDCFCISLDGIRRSIERDLLNGSPKSNQASRRGLRGNATQRKSNIPKAPKFGDDRALTIETISLARQVDLVMATNQVLGEGVLNPGVLSNACKTRAVTTNKKQGAGSRVVVESFLKWISAKHDLDDGERIQIRNAIMGEILARNSIRNDVQ